MRNTSVGETSTGLGPIVVSLCKHCGKDHPQENEPSLQSESTVDRAAARTQLASIKPFASNSSNIDASSSKQFVARVKYKNVNSNSNNSIDISTNNANVQQKYTFEQMLADIRSIFDAPGKVVDIDEVKDVLRRYESDPSDWQKYALYDSSKYTRNLVDEHEKYNVMVLSWGLGVKSRIHDHSGSHCFMKLLDGQLKELRFEWPKNDGQGMKFISANTMDPTGEEILYINDHVGLHRVENTSTTEFGTTLHIYIPPYRSCKCFEETTGKSNECNVVFDSKRGKKVD